MIDPTMTPNARAWTKYNLLISDINDFAAGLQEGERFNPTAWNLLNHQLGFALKELEAQGFERCDTCGHPGCTDCKDEN